MSIFNRPYKSDEDLEADTKNSRREERMKMRSMKDKFAEQIFKAVIDAIDGGTDNFSKREMVKLVHGEAQISALDWVVWGKACTTAIAKIRRTYWPKDVTRRRMFNFVRDMGRYWLIPIDGSDPSVLATNVVYEEYDRKVKGMMKKMRETSKSAYRQMLKLNREERVALIKELRDQKLLNGE